MWVLTVLSRSHMLIFANIGNILEVTSLTAFIFSSFFLFLLLEICSIYMLCTQRSWSAFLFSLHLEIEWCKVEMFWYNTEWFINPSHSSDVIVCGAVCCWWSYQWICVYFVQEGDFTMCVDQFWVKLGNRTFKYLNWPQESHF